MKKKICDGLSVTFTRLQAFTLDSLLRWRLPRPPEPAVALRVELLVLAGGSRTIHIDISVRCLADP